MHSGGQEGQRVPESFKLGTSANQFRKLESSLSLSVGADVILLHNLWVQGGLVNGAVGRVTHIDLPEHAKPFDLPLRVIVQFPKCAELPNFPTAGSLPLGSVIIVPVSVQQDRGNVSVDGRAWSRLQLPLSLAHAGTVHKSQVCDVYTVLFMYHMIS